MLFCEFGLVIDRLCLKLNRVLERIDFMYNWRPTAVSHHTRALSILRPALFVYIVERRQPQHDLLVLVFMCDVVIAAARWCVAGAPQLQPAQSSWWKENS